MKLLKATTSHTKEIRAIAAKFGIKHCKLGTNTVMVGRQTVHVDSKVAVGFIDAVKAAGYYVHMEDTLRELAAKQLSDTFMFQKITYLY